MDVMYVIVLVLVSAIAVVAVMFAFYWRARYYNIKTIKDQRIKELEALAEQSGFGQSGFNGGPWR